MIADAYVGVVPLSPGSLDDEGDDDDNDDGNDNDDDNNDDDNDGGNDVDDDDGYGAALFAAGF